MQVGSWFDYKVTIERSDVGITDSFIERYTVVELDGTKPKFICSRDGTAPIEVNDRNVYVGKVFEFEDLSKDNTVSIDTVFGKIVADVYKSNRCGGGETVYLGPDFYVYIDIKTQLWSGGILYKETREFVDRTV